MQKDKTLAYKSKRFPHSPTMKFVIDTNTWKIGFAHYEDYMCRAVNTEIQFLCFLLIWREFIEDRER